MVKIFKFASNGGCAFLVVAGLGFFSPTRAQEPVSTYHMQVELSPSEKMLQGSQEITWRNTSKAPIQELRFHLYLNAFRDFESTFMKEVGHDWRQRWSAKHKEFGGIHLKELRLLGPGGETDLQWVFIRPDDQNPDDRTVISVELPQAVGPGESIELRSRFEVKLPKAYRRTGWVGDHSFFCMQWFPKLGVLQDTADGNAWNCHQFHANSEFFADFSNYQVEITLPNAFKVGATGGEAREEAQGEKTVHKFRQQNVHDFAWVASKNFSKHVEVDEASKVQLILLLQVEHDSQVQIDRHLQAAKVALEFYGSRFGPYPYQALTIVDSAEPLTADGDRLGAGMEYPTLICAGTKLFPHSRADTPESVVTHEFGHQYFYGMSASNEFEEPWLDEGLTTFTESRCRTLARAVPAEGRKLMLRTSEFGLLNLAGMAGKMSPQQGLAEYGQIPLAKLPLGSLPDKVQEWLQVELPQDTSLVLMPSTPLLDLLRDQPSLTYFREVRHRDALRERARYLRVTNPDPMVGSAWQFRNRDSYISNSYSRPTTLLSTLERLVGKERWWAFLRLYFQQTQYQHPNSAQFVALLEKELGAGPKNLFLAAIAANARLDFGIDFGQMKLQAQRKEVVIRDYGNVPARVQVRFTFAGLEKPVTKVWSSKEGGSHKFVFDDELDGEVYGALQEVWVDPPPMDGSFEDDCYPAGVYLLDSNLLNNAWSQQRNQAPAAYRGLRRLLQVQSQLFYAGLIG